MISIKHGKKISALFLFAVQTIFAANLYVSKPEDGRGAYQTIMAAMKDAKAGDSIIILDAAVYEEQVIIDSTKNGLVLTSENPTSRIKPTIKWQDRVNIGPKSCPEAKIESNITFDQNGALQLKRVRGAVVNGIAVDGGGTFIFGYPTVWGPDDCAGQLFPMQHGNAAIAIWVSGDVTITNCDISNAYFGISIKDRNEGGINANPNPSDIEKKRIVPLSGFGKTGNHLFDQNRIHNNSFGMFFESTWDLGSVIRYNLFYENHHSTTAFGATVKKLTSEGNNLPGGAIMFKDHLFSPIAIYNNTFWHNFLIYIGGWRPGNNYLVFNNIYSSPHVYWSLEPNFQNPFTALDPAFVYRTHNSVYATQTEAPKVQLMTVQQYDQTAGVSVVKEVVTYQPRIMNGMGDVESINMTVPLELSDTIVLKTVQSAKVEGNLIIGQSGTKPTAFPKEANVRWLETKFKSTNPDSSDFLVPDWDDSLVNQFILDQGWPEGGILDADGSIADLGAIPFAGRSKTIVTITPTDPVIIDITAAPTKANVSFTIDVKSGTFNNPKIKYIRWISNIDTNSTSNAFGGNVAPLPLNVIKSIPIPTDKLVVGEKNSLTFDIPAHDKTKLYGFFEIVVEGTDDQGNLVSSSVGTISYRRLDYMFEVEVLSADLSTVLDEVTVGQPYVLRLKPLKISDKSQPFTSKIDTVNVSLRSPFTLWTPAEDTFTIKGGIPAGAGVLDKQIMFTKVPASGFDAITASGIFSNSASGGKLAIYGTSADIKINPGPPEKILFQTPPSNGLAVVDPGMLFNVKIQVYDKYDNKVKQVTAVKLESTKPDIGDIDGLNQVNSDTNGVAILQVKVTGGERNDTFPIVGTLVMNNYVDNAKMLVGIARNRFFIYYGDTVSYDPTVQISPPPCTGVRIPLQIRVSTDGFDIVKAVNGEPLNNEFAIEFNNDVLVAYKSELDTVPITLTSLVNGVANIWIQAKSGSISNASITVTNLTPLNRVITGSRAGINFIACVTNINRAEYHTNNGFGRVDVVNLYYLKSIKESDMPDSLKLFWPATGDNLKIVPRSAMVLDTEDSTHVIVTLPDPFPDEITYSAQRQLGTSYWKNPVLPDIQVFPFLITEKVGPLIKSAKLIERLIDGVADTLIVEFSEFIKSDKITGNSLLLTRDGGVPLNVLSMIQVSSVEVKLAIENKGEPQTPKAGDSLKILVTDGISKIVDGSENSAHPDNRPVIITLEEVAPQITDAIYGDRNADGLIDFVTISFNKKVDISKQSYAINFRSNITSGTLNSSRAVLYAEGDSTKIVLDLSNGGLPSTAAGFTDGAMIVTVIDADYTTPIPPFSASDKAAPVIKSAVYYQGRVFEDGTIMPDTLKVEFSENLEYSALTSSDPLVFLQTVTGTVYNISLSELSHQGSGFVFKVDGISTTGINYVVDGDSVRINITEGAKFTDIAGNTQMVVENRRVRLKLIEQPVELKITMGPNPYIPDLGSDQLLKLKVQPGVTREQQELNFKVEMTILDNMGNFIYNNESSSSDVAELTWDGTNKKGRLVGTGTYLVYIKTTVLSKNEITSIEKRKLAVKREKK